ncbi:MAG: hypothetical protein IPO21_09180 [Bacteroidales bacterium]|nr:hypothetical protein [Bacteroidales bacterium]
MLNYEQFEINCNRMDAELATEIARQSEFIDTLEQAIVNLSLQQFPELEQHKHLFIEDITRCAHKQVVDINELLDFNLGGNNNDDNTKLLSITIPPRDVTQEEQLFLKETLKKLPPEQHQTFIKLHEERLKDEAEERTLLFLCYDKTKEFISQFFPEIVDFTGNTIRNIDRSAFINMHLWVEEFYYLTGEYLNHSSKQ